MTDTRTNRVPSSAAFTEMLVPAGAYLLALSSRI